MNTVTHIMELDLYTTTSYPVVKAQQFDTATRTLRVLLKDHEEPYVLTDDVSVSLVGDRPDGTSFLILGTIDPDNRSIVSFDITQALMSAGVVTAKVKIMVPTEGMENTTVLSSIPLYIDVEQDVADMASATEEEKNIIQELVDEVIAMTGAFEDHVEDNIRHLTQAEHERFNTLNNTIYSDEEPSSQQEGDAWLKEY